MAENIKWDLVWDDFSWGQPQKFVEQPASGNDAVSATAIGEIKTPGHDLSQMSSWFATYDPTSQWKTISFSDQLANVGHQKVNFSDKKETFSTTPCATCKLQPGSFGYVVVPMDVYFKSFYKPYGGPVELLKCKHPGSIRVQILNNGAYHGLCVDILREFVIIQ